MSLVGSVVMGAYLSVPNPVYFENAEQEAYKQLAKATYLHFELDVVAKRIEKKYTPKWVYTYGPYVGPVIQLATEQRLTYTWRF